MPRFILLNGPPRSGKSALAERLARLLLREVDAATLSRRSIEVRAIAQELKERTHALYGYPLAHDHFDSTKDTPCDFFFGKTPREAYTAVGETYLKAIHGAAVLGRLLIRSLELRHPHDIVIVPGAGFEEEARVLIEAAGAENVLLARIHMGGRDFPPDPRQWLRLPEIRSIDVENGISRRSVAAFDTLNFITSAWPDLLARVSSWPVASGKARS